MYKISRYKVAHFKVIAFTVGFISLFILSIQPTLLASSNDQTSFSQNDLALIFEIQQLHKEAENQIKNSMASEGIDTIEETKKAIISIENGKNNEALEAIEHAIRKINTLLTQHPKDELLPVDFEIRLIDNAPMKIKSIREIGFATMLAVEYKNYTNARSLLDKLRSELHIRSYNLPLVLYPKALREALSLLNKQKAEEAKSLLVMALSTLVVIEQVLPVPLINAKMMLSTAEEKCKTDKDLTLEYLAKALHELDRATELGYSGKDEYKGLRNQIDNLQEQVMRGTSNQSTFSALKAKLTSLIKSQFVIRKNHDQPELEREENCK